MDTLITSSPTTLEWLTSIRSKIEQQIPSVIYREFKYWASFKSPGTKRNVVFLQPQKTQIRLFTKLATSFDGSLQSTPSSNKWANMYPSIFLIKSVNSIDKACGLIIDSYKEDLSFG